MTKFWILGLLGLIFGIFSETSGQGILASGDNSNSIPQEMFLFIAGFTEPNRPETNNIPVHRQVHKTTVKLFRISPFFREHRIKWKP